MKPIVVVAWVALYDRGTLKHLQTHKYSFFQNTFAPKTPFLGDRQKIDPEKTNYIYGNDTLGDRQQHRAQKRHLVGKTRFCPPLREWTIEGPSVVKQACSTRHPIFQSWFQSLQRVIEKPSVCVMEGNEDWSVMGDDRQQIAAARSTPPGERERHTHSSALMFRWGGRRHSCVCVCVCLSLRPYSSKADVTKQLTPRLRQTARRLKFDSGRLLKSLTKLFHSKYDWPHWKPCHWCLNHVCSIIILTVKRVLLTHL